MPETEPQNGIVILVSLMIYGGYGETDAGE